MNITFAQSAVCTSREREDDDASGA
eukprot:COSAG01_NODE_27881_length_674_cov_1.406957_1_plen_24_part_10